MKLYENAGHDGASLEAPFALRADQIRQGGDITMDQAYRDSYARMKGQNEVREMIVEDHKECLAALEKVKTRLADIYRKLRAHEFDPEGPDDEFIATMKAEQTELDRKRIELQDRLDELSERLGVATAQHDQRMGYLKLLYQDCSPKLKNGIQQQEGTGS